MVIYFKMNEISEEIQRLQLKLLELEKKKESEEKNKTLMNPNFKVIEEILIEKKNNIKKNNYSKSAILARYYDQQMVMRLEPIYNILKIMDERLTKLEE
jgi:hypothetical protein